MSRAPLNAPALLDKPPGDEDLPSFPLGTRPFDAFSVDVSLPSDSDGVMSKIPRAGEQAAMKRTIAVSLPLNAAAPMGVECFPSSEPNSAKRPGGQQVEDAPPSQRGRTDSQMERDFGQDDAEFRGRFRLHPYVSKTGTGTAPRVSTPDDIPNATPRRAGPLMT